MYSSTFVCLIVRWITEKVTNEFSRNVWGKWTRNNQLDF